MKVTASDLTKYEGLAQITGIDVGTTKIAAIIAEDVYKPICEMKVYF